MRATPAPTRSSLPLKTRLGYGVGDMAGSATVTLYGFFMNAFLLDVAGLRPASVGFIFLFSQLWDALCHPLVGILSDRTRSKYGRKRAWLLWGALPFGLAYFLHWWVPPLEGGALVGYYLLLALLFKTAIGAVSTPLTALAADMTDDPQARMQLNTYRFALNLFASLLAVVLHPLLVGLAGSDVRAGYVISAGFWGIFVVASTLVAFSTTFENRPQPLSSAFNLWRDVATALKNRTFLCVTLVFLASGLVIFFVQNNLLLYCRYWIRLESQFTTLILLYQVTVIVSLGLWARAARTVDKRQLFVVGVLLWSVGLCALFFTPRDTLWPYLALAVLLGVGQAVAAYLVPWTMLPEVVDEDELESGERREGLFYGMFILLQQIGLSIGLAASNFALERAGYVTPAPGQTVAQPESVLTTLRLLVSFVPAALVLLAIPAALAYPISRARLLAIRAQLEARALGRAVD